MSRAISTSTVARLFTFIACLFFRAGLCHDHTVTTSLDTYKYGDLYEVRDVQMVDNEAVQYERTQRRRLPMGRELSFTAVGKEFDLKVILNLELTEVYGESPKIYGALAGDAEPHDRSYRGEGFIEKCTKAGDCEFYGEVEKTSVTFFEFFGEHVFHALMRLEKEEFSVDPKRFINKERFMNGGSFPSSDSPLTSLEADMYFYSSTEMFEKSTDQDTGDVMFLPKRRLLQQVTVFTNCYQGQGQATFRISMGMLIDNGFYAVTGGNSGAVRDYVAGMFNDMNTMYSKQMGVEIALQTLVLGDTTGFTQATFNEAPTRPGQKTCPSGKQPSTRLNELRQWRQTYHSNNLGLWHLMTHCHPPSGTVGIAYVGALCHSFGVGLSSYLGTGTWEVLAHEVGHNFGSGHTFDRGVSGGIMDYGDGLLNGVYQFHPVHKNEVCSEISSSLTRQRAVAACWSTQTTPAPVAPPTPRPVAPTPRPTAPTPRPTVVIPTNRPTATPRPTVGPTNRPTVAPNGSVFQWRDTGAFGACSVTCGSGFQSEIIQCRRYDLSTCTIPTNANTNTCSTYDFAARGCSSTIVANTMCSTSCRPTPTTQACNNGACGGNTCGDGVLNKDEYCDTAIDSCCASSCTQWKTGANSGCVGTNPIVDAAVMDYEERLYLFQGSNFMVYADMDATTPLDGYPKPIDTIVGLDASFHSGIDSASSFYDNIVFLFKGLTFTVVDLDEMEAIGGVRSATSYFSLSSQMQNCGKIDAILSYYWTLDLICDDITAEFSWQTDATGPAELVTDKWNLGFPANIAPGQATAAVRNPQTGRIRVYQGSYMSTWNEGSNTPAVARSPPVAGRVETACLVDNCATCRSDGKRCNACETGFRRKRGGRLCKRPRNFVDLSFDDNGYSAAFQQYTAGHEVASADNGGWDLGGGVIVDGAFGYGMHLDGTQTTRLQPHDFGGPVDHWKISLWWKPEKLVRQRLLTINRDRGNGYNEMFTIDFVHESETEPIGAANFGIEVWMYDQRVDCYVDNPITVNEWNKVSVEFGLGYIITSANGVKHQLQMNTGGSDDYAVDFQDWYIGERSNHAEGISGVIDKFEVANLDIPDSQPVESGKTPTWVLAVAITATVFILSLVGFFFVRCYCRPKWCKPQLAEHLNANDTDGGMPRAPTPSSEENYEGVKAMPTGMIQATGGAPLPPRPKKKAGKRPPPRGKSGKRPANPPPPPAQSRGNRLDLGQTAEERRESWRI